MTRHYQDNTRIPTNSYARITQRVESGNNISQNKDMNPQKDAMITRQALEQHMVDEDNQWTLESPMRTLKMGSLSALTTTSMDIWQRNTKQRRGQETRTCFKCDKEGHIAKYYKGNKHGRQKGPEMIRQ